MPDGVSASSNEISLRQHRVQTLINLIVNNPGCTIEQYHALYLRSYCVSPRTYAYYIEDAKRMGNLEEVLDRSVSASQPCLYPKGMYAKMQEQRK